MSKSIVKQTLELFNEEIEHEEGKKTKKKPIKKRKLKVEEKPINQLKLKCVLDDVRKKSRVDLTEKNLAFLNHLKCSSGKVDSPSANKIFEQQRGKLCKNLPKISKRKPRKESTLFTEEDFQKFESEYFIR